MLRRRGQRGSGPGWQGTAGPKVLLEDPDPAMLWAGERALLRAGFSVANCLGPDGDARLYPYGRCLLVRNGNCPLADAADVVVFGLGLHSEGARAVLRALRESRPQMPICIDAPAPEVEAHADLVTGCEQIPFPASAESFTRAVRRGIERARSGTHRGDSALAVDREEP